MKKVLFFTAMLTVLTCLPWAVNAQSLGDYTFSTGTDASKWVTITSTTQLISGTGDSKASNLLNIGFSFPFGDNVYTQYSVNTDGNLKLGSPVTTTYDYSTPFSSTTANANNPKINAFGCDGYRNNTTDHYVKSQLVGDSLLVVEFCMGTYTNSTRSQKYKWQIHLFSNGNIEIVFPDESGIPATAPADAHQCGLCVNSSDGWVISLSDNTATHFTAGSTITNASGTWFDANRYYRFTRPVITCPKPAGLEVTALTPTNATISWNAEESGVIFQGKAIASANVDPSDVTFTDDNNISTNQQSFSVLDNRDYTFVLRKICGPGDTSYATKIEFKTPCLSKPLPYYEDFTDYTAVSSNSATSGYVMPDCWNSNWTATPYSSYDYSPKVTTNSSYQPGTGNYLYAMAGGSSYSYYQDPTILILPSFGDVSFDTVLISFRARVSNVSYGDLLVGYVNPSGVFTSLTPAEEYTSGNAPLQTIYLSQYSIPSGSRLAFKVDYTYSYSSYAYHVGLDDITVEAMPSCFEPSGLTASNVTSTTATLSWQRHTMGTETNWVLQYGTDKNFTPGTYTELQAMNTPTLSVYSLTTERLYYARVKADCGSGDESDWSNVCSFWPTATTPVTVNEEGQSTLKHIPFWGYAASNGTPALYASRSQFILPADLLAEINPGSTIRKLTFYCNEVNGNWGEAQFTVKKKEVNNTAFTSKYFDESGLTLVYTGTLSVKNNEMEIVLDQGFIYNGGNLLLDMEVLQIATGNIFNPDWYGVNGSENNSLYKYKSNSYWTGPEYSTFLPKVTFNVNQAEVTCDRPKNVAFTAINHEHATVTWASEENEWEIAWSSDANFDPDQATTTGTATTKSYTIPGLSATTTYYVYVRSKCGNEYGLWSSVKSFQTTEQVPSVGSGWTDNFEGNDCEWTLVNGSVPNKWAWGNAVNNGGTKALYISNDDGVTNAYTNGSSSVVFATKKFYFDKTKYTFSFDWKSVGEENYDYFRVALVPASVELTAGTSTPSGYSYSNLPSDWIAVDGGGAQYAADWQNSANIVNVTEAGVYKVVLGWRNDGYGGDNPPAALDNFSIIPLPCPYDVENVTVAENPAPTQTTATLNWNGGDATQWQVAYTTDETFETLQTRTVSSPTVELTGLEHSSHYHAKVRAFCGGSDYGEWSSVVDFHTACGIYTLTENKSYTCDFSEKDTATNMPFCWSHAGSGVTECTTPTYYDSNEKLEFKNASGAGHIIAVLPEFANLSTLRLGFKLKAGGNNVEHGTFDVGYMTNVSDTNSFVSIANYVATNDEFYGGSWVDKKVLLTSVPANVRLAMRFVKDELYANYAYLDWAVDDVVLEIAPTCLEPASTTVSNLANDSVTLSWQPAGNESLWNLQYRQQGENNWVELNDLGSTTRNLVGLMANTTYEWRVQAKCSANDLSSWTDGDNFTTRCNPIPIPFVYGFEDYVSGNGTVPYCWNVLRSYNFYNDYPSVTTYAANAYSGSNALAMFVYGNTPGNSNYTMISMPPVPAENPLNTLQINFFATKGSSGGSGSIVVGVIEYNHGNPVFVPVDTVSLGLEYEENEVSFENYTGNGDEIAFKVTLTSSASSNNHYAYIDSITVAPIPPCKSVTYLWGNPQDHSVELHWSPKSNSNPDLYVVRYGTVEDPETYLGGYSTNETLYNFTGLRSDSLYYFHVKAVCGQDESEWTTTSVRTYPGYCSNLSYISAELTGEGINTAKVFWTPDPDENIDYYDIAILTEQVSDFDDLYTEGVSDLRTYIGYPDTVIDVPNVQYDPNFTLSPNTTYYAYVRAHCTLGDGYGNWIFTSFKTYSACREPENPRFMLTGPRTAVAQWDNVSQTQDNNFKIILSEEYLTPAQLENRNPTYSGITTTSMSFDENDLLLNTTYYLYVANDCGNTGVSTYVYGGSVTTPNACPMIRNLEVTATTASAASLTWSRGIWGEENEWLVEVRQNDQPIRTSTVYEPTINLLGLDPQTTYEVRVSAVCSPTLQSQYTAATVTTSAVGGGCEQVGDGEYSGNLPVTNYDYAYTQMIYTADKFSKSGNIVSLKLQRSNYTNEMNNMKVYLGTTDKSTFASTIDWVAAEDLTQVYSGSFAAGTDEWLELQLSNPFPYDGTDNLVVAISNAHGDWHTIQYFKYTSTDNTILYRRADSQPAYANHPGSDPGYAVGSERTNIQFCFQSSTCPQVSNLAVDSASVTSNSVTVTWLPGSSEETWYYTYSETEITDFSNVNWTMVNVPSAELTNLLPDTRYYIYVYPNISGDNTCIDNIASIEYFKEPSCKAPTNPVVRNVDAHSATIAWQDPNNMAQPTFRLYYGEYPNPDWNNPIMVNDTTVVLPSLTPNTQYQVILFAYCGLNDGSYGIGFNFTTEAEPQLACEGFVKLTQTPNDWTGKYLIVSESHNVAFDGSRDPLDVGGAKITVAPENGVIPFDEVNKASYFTIAASENGYSIKSASGKYIGNNSASNGLSESTTIVYDNTLSIDNDGNAVITGSGGYVLRYNSQNNNGMFRYYNGTQNPIQLYKYVDNRRMTATIDTTVTHTLPFTFTMAGQPDTIITNYGEFDLSYVIETDPVNCDSVLNVHLTVNEPMYTVTLNAGNGTTQVASLQGNSTNPVDLTNVSAAPNAACTDWTFAGWSLIPVTETQTEPALITGTYTPTGDTTFYAVYQMTAQGSSTTSQGVTASVDFSQLGYINAQAISNVAIDNNVTTTFAQGSNSNNAPKYYNTGTAIRCYGGNTFTVSSEKTITNIALTFGTGDGSNDITTDVNTYDNGTWTGSANSVTFTIEGSSGQRRIAGISVTYSAAQPVVTTYNSNPDCGTVTDMYQVSAIAADDNTGSVSGTVGNDPFVSGDYAAGTQITLTATPAEGYEFINWTKYAYPQGEEVSTDATYTFTVSEDISLIAYFTPKDYQVNYELNQGSWVTGYIAPDFYTYGVGVTLPTANDVEYFYHTFEGWYNNAQFTGDAITAISTTDMGDTTLYAKWTPDKFTITYMDGNTTLHIDTVAYGADVPAFADPEKECMAFAGWDGTIPTVMPANDIVVNAQWTDIYYNITATAEPANAGSVIMDPEPVVGTTEATSGYKCGTTVTLTANANMGYRFVDWTVNGQSVSAGAELVITAAHDSAFVANFEANKYTVTYMDGNTTLHIDTVAYGADVPAFADPEKECMAFAGWDGTIPTVMPANDIVVNAQWTDIYYNITATAEPANAGSVIMDPEATTNSGYKCGTQVTLTANANMGYSFVDWTVNGQSVSTDAELVVTAAHDSAFVANFEANTYNITWNLNDGTYNGESLPTTYTYGQTYTLPTANEMSKDNHSFAGWYTNANFSGSAVTVIPDTAMGDKAFYAKWAENAYTITLVQSGDGSISSDPEQTAAAGAVVTLTATPNAGYSFGSWEVRNLTTGLTVEVTNDQFTMPAANVEVHASFTAIEYTVTATANPAAGGTITGAGTYYYEGVASLTAIANDGYSFVNWTNAQGAVVSSDATYSFSVTRDSALTANFETNKYTVTYMDGNTTLHIDTVAYGEDVPAFADPEKACVVFAGWDGTIPTVMPANDIVVNAQWTDIYYNITATAEPANAGSVTMDPEAVVGTTAANSGYVCGTQVTLTASASDGYAFVDWTVNGQSVSTATVLVVTAAHDSAFVANFEANKYTVTYMDGNTILHIDTVAYGADVPAFADPEKACVVFAGWDGTIPTVMPANDIEVNAQWTDIYYNITATAEPANAGSVTMDPEATNSGYKCGTQIILTANANMGYSFVDWTVNGQSVSTAAVLVVTAAHDSAFLANFEANTYNITWNLNDGTYNGGTLPTTYTFGQAYTLPTANEMSKDNHSFEGWYTNANFSGSAVTVIPDTATGDKAFYAKWTENVYTVNVMQAANGSILADQTSATAGTTINLTATPAQGYHFGYWEVSKAATHIDPVTVTNNSFEMPASDVYVNAIFWIDTLHVTATVNPAQSGTVNPADTLVAYGNDVTLTATPAQDYLFTNWTVNGQAVSADASITITVTQDSALVANFTAMETVAKPTLLPAGGTFTSEDNVSVTMTCATPNATIYYTLDGSDPVYPRTRNVTGTQIYSEPVAINSTTTVKAVAVVNDMIPSEMAVETYRFVKMRYVNGWNTLNGTVTYSPEKDTAGATITVTATPNEGYSFETWNVFDFAGNDVTVTNNTFIMPDTDVYVSASFTPNTYTVSATVNPTNAGTVDGAGDYTFHSDVEMRATPNNEYLFVNWTNTHGTVVSTNPLFDFELQAGDTAFVANFVAKQTVVTPVILPVSGTYAISVNEGMQVTITCETPNASIYYTLDGTEPTEQSSLYAEGTIISLNQAGTTTVKAIAVAQDMLQSATASETYRLVMKHTVMACNPVNCDIQVYKTGTWDLYDTYADTLGANMKVHLDINTLIYNLDTVYANDFDGNPLTITQVDNALYNNFAFTMPDTDVCVTAECSLKQFSVHFVPNGGTLIGYAADTFYVYGQMLIFPTANEISYEGHTFLGWYDNPNFTGDPMTGLAAGSYVDNSYYYAKWDINNYGLTINYLDENGRPLAPAHTENLDYGDSYNVPTPAVDTYMPDQAVVSGVMGTSVVTVTVTYTQIVMNAIDNQTLCADATTTQINFTSPVQIGTISYEWTNDNTAIGLDANGTQDNIAAFTALNAGTDPVVATVTVTPTCTYNQLSVAGVPQTFTITVNPKHTSEFSETVCDSYTWNWGNVDTVITDEGTHDYVHVFANQYGCDSTVTLHLTLYKTPTAITYTTEPNTSCDNAAPNGKITVTAPMGDFEYSLDGIDWQTTTEFADLAANEYTVYVRPVSSECALTQNVTVDDNIVMPLSTPSVSKAFYCLSENITLDGTGSSTGADYTYAWAGPDNYTSTELSPDFEATNGSQSGTYVLTVTNTVTSCVTEASVDVVVNTPTTSNYLFTITAHGDAYANIDEGQTEVAPVFATPEVRHYLNNTCTTVNDAAATYNTVGDYTINWTSTDECGNTATCTQVLHVTQNVCPVAADADGNTYPAVQLAGKCWTAKNLRTTQFSDGRPVTNLMVYENIMYPNTTENLDRYGYLYDWTTALDAENGVTMDANNNVQGICPTGWHIPTHEDFMSIAGYNTPTDMFDLRYNNYWLDGGGSNSTNYSLLPGGCYNDNTGRYENLLGNAYLWGVNSANPSQPRVYWADCKCYMWQVNDTTEGMGYSVRCIKD